MDEGSIVFVAVVLFVSYLVRGIAGFGSALIAVPLLSLNMPIMQVVPLIVLFDYLGSAAQAYKNRHNVAWADLLRLLPFSFIGIGLALWILSSVPDNAMRMALGVFVIGFAIYQLFPGAVKTMSDWLAIPSGVLGGLSGTLFGAGGPFYVIYFSLRQLPKELFRGSFAMLFILDGTIRLLGYAAIGEFPAYESILYALPVVAIGLYLGGKIHTSLNKQQFQNIISVLLLMSGSALLLKGAL